MGSKNKSYSVGMYSPFRSGGNQNKTNHLIAHLIISTFPNKIY